MLFDEGRIGTLTLQNRLIRSATAEALADEAGTPRPSLARMYADLACGGVGLIISGHMGVHRAGKAHAGMTMIDTDRVIPSLTELARAVHVHGSLLAAQINHAGRQARHGIVDDPVGPSDLPPAKTRSGARAMTLDEIEQAIEAFAAAAERAFRAGFDAVQIHAAHGYLISQFLSPLANTRTDTWGGSWENRTRLLRRIAAAVRERVGAGFPVLVKLGLRDESEVGLSLKEGVAIVQSLSAWGIDAVEISGGVAETGTYSVHGRIDPGENEAYFRPWARAARAVAAVPIALVGGIRSREVMEDLLQSGDAQFISLCRPLLCEPDLPLRLRRGLQTASSCVSGNRCWPAAGEEGISCKCPDVVRPDGQGRLSGTRTEE
jgi:2,4-dienoyl-CoA reductase-like NADH-dependent reductase (Old Yellow Enzyme family)